MSVLARVRVRVPASTSNIGPGFDCLGLALSLYNELTLELHDDPGEDEALTEGEGRNSFPTLAYNLAYVGARASLDTRHPKGKTLRIVLKSYNRIPLARGLGSSAAAILAGQCAANNLLGRYAYPHSEIFQLATLLEGHPDNVAASFHGGLTVSWREKTDARCFHLKPHKKLTAVVAVPDFQLSTAKARAALPKKVPRADAVFNISRAMLLASALERGLWDRLAFAMDDRIHQPYRRPLVKGFDAVVAAAKKAGAPGACLSGAGPSILALMPAGPRCVKVGEAMRRAWRAKGVASRFLVLKPDAKGVDVRREA